MKMKRGSALLLVLPVFLCITAPSEAALTVRGTDVNGSRLIYDSTLNVTWYDFSNQQGRWQQQANWASNLSVNVNGKSVTGWRLPNAAGNPVSGYNLNSTANEMGYLYYAELGNRGIYDVNGNIQSGWGLLNAGPFRNLVSTGYWSGALADPGSRLYFKFSSGWQSGNSPGSAYLALAVHNGDIVPTPVPGSFWLLGTGLTGLFALRRRRKPVGTGCN